MESAIRSEQRLGESVELLASCESLGSLASLFRQSLRPVRLRVPEIMIKGDSLARHALKCLTSVAL